MKALALLLVFALVGCTNAGTGGDIEGTWELVSFDTGGGSESVRVGVNTRDVPWVDFGDRVDGNLGCNGFGGTYKYWRGELVFDEVFSELAACLGETIDDESPMTTETLIRDEFFWGNSIAVSISGDEMLWEHGGTRLIWRSIEGPPPPPTIPPQTSVGPMDCGNDEVVFEEVLSDGSDFDSNKTAGEELIESLPGVATFDQPDPGGLVWYGYDAAGEAVVVVAFQDISPEFFKIYTCP